MVINFLIDYRVGRGASVIIVIEGDERCCCGDQETGNEHKEDENGDNLCGETKSIGI